MRSKVVVFLGPSLPADVARSVLDADFRPPAKRGDLLRAAREGAQIIGLIDGVFFQESAVAHKEILDAIALGVRVVGSSSMGALRAAETDVFGMVGVGEIYKAYRRGDLVSDDEVALTFDPVTYAPISEPLVNIRYNLRLAEKEGCIDPEGAKALLEISRSQYFSERGYESLLRKARGLVPDSAISGFEAFLAIKRRDLKRDDAILALRKMADMAREEMAKVMPRDILREDARLDGLS